MHGPQNPNHAIAELETFSSTHSKLENYTRPSGLGDLKCSFGLGRQSLFKHEEHKYQVYDSEERAYIICNVQM